MTSDETNSKANVIEAAEQANEARMRNKFGTELRILFVGGGGGATGAHPPSSWLTTPTYRRAIIFLKYDDPADPASHS